MGKTVEGEDYDNKGEIPMKGKKVLPNEIRFNKIGPVKNELKRRNESSSSSSDEENGK